MPVLSYRFRKIWETGVVAGIEIDVQNLEVDGHGFVNPLFALSSAPNGTFAVHYGTDLLLGFHLASAFDDETCSERDLKNKIVGLAKAQFSEWSTTNFLFQIRTILDKTRRNDRCVIKDRIVKICGLVFLQKWYDS